MVPHGVYVRVEKDGPDGTGRGHRQVPAELLDGSIDLAEPGVYFAEVRHVVWAVDGVFGDRQQLHRLLRVSDGGV
jgi:hypothetical protein